MSIKLYIYEVNGIFTTKFLPSDVIIETVSNNIIIKKIVCCIKTYTESIHKFLIRFKINYPTTFPLITISTIISHCSVMRCTSSEH